MKKIISLVLCLFLALQIAPVSVGRAVATTTDTADTTEYYAEFKAATVTVYDGIDGAGYNTLNSMLPETFIVKKAGSSDSGEWYYVTDPYWIWYDYYVGTYRYVKASALNVLGPAVTEVSAGVGSFSVKVNGAPKGAELSLKKISEKNYNYEGFSPYKTKDMGALLGAYDIRIIKDGNEWQPSEGNLVTVTMSAAAWGLFDGERVHLIHEHKNADGTVDFERIGPLYIENGYVSFQTDKFSDFYAFEGTYTETFASGNHNLYVEPGSVVNVEVSSWLGSGLDSITKNSGASTITVTDRAIVVAQNAVIGDSAVITAKYSGWLGSSTATITVTVTSRQDKIAALLEHPIMIAILDQSSGKFPSEPTRTSSGTYYHINDSDGDGTYTGQSGSTNFNATASKYLNTAMVNSSAWMTDVNGELIYGVVDALGKETLAAFVNGVGEQTVDWQQIAQIISQYNDNTSGTGNDIAVMYNQESGTTFATHTVYLTTDSTKTIASYGSASIDDQQVYYGEFKLVPYVIKHQDDVWHVDVAVVRGDAYTLGYEINLGEYTLVNQTVALPDAQVYVEDPSDSDTLLTVTLADWTYKSTTFNVVNADGTEGTIRFKGWWTSPTATTDDTLYQPGDTIILNGIETKLYAIWDVSQSLKKTVNTLTVYNAVSLVSTAQTGSLLPTHGTTDFVPFTFTVDMPFSTTGEFKDVELTLNRIAGSTNGVAEWTKIVAKLSDIAANPTAHSKYITIGTDTITIKLYDGEAVRFSEVPVYTAADETKVHSFTITQEITERTKKYSTVDGAESLTQSKIAAMSEATATNTQFYTYYTPPVAGLAISSVGGDVDEAYIYLVSIVSSTAIDIATFRPIKLVVPAGAEVTVANLAVGQYRIDRITAWDTLYDVDADSKTITVEDGKTHKIAFNYTLTDGQWEYGHSITTVIAKEGSTS